ncbi:MAG: hypothetical protein A2285_03910 [Elusimicrobia bacterium RIFOXYA12_FULL_57_11]|nr:MAG: hypothetical protein A2285_03910 [Elusimicrobia bacterium RIFOXYA12_FULL_57_11]
MFFLLKDRIRGFAGLFAIITVLPFTTASASFRLAEASIVPNVCLETSITEAEESWSLRSNSMCFSAWNSSSWSAYEDCRGTGAGVITPL